MRENVLKEGLETTEEEIIMHLLKAEEDIENGRTVPAEVVFKEWSEKYGI